MLLEKFPKSCNWYIIISSQNSLLEFRLVSENYYYDFCTPTKSSGERPNGKMRGSTVFLSAVTFVLHSNAHSAFLSKNPDFRVMFLKEIVSKTYLIIEKSFKIGKIV